MELLTKSLTVIVALVGAGLAGHLLTYYFLSATNLFPESHRDEQQRISMWIGITERLVVALLTMFGAMAVTVFVFATKAGVMSTRLDGMKDDKRRTAEFVLIGTMVSYLFGMLFGLAGKGVLSAITLRYSAPRPIGIQIQNPVDIKMDGNSNHLTSEARDDQRSSTDPRKGTK